MSTKKGFWTGVGQKREQNISRPPVVSTPVIFILDFRLFYQGAFGNRRFRNRVDLSAARAVLTTRPA
jgi:hypothetical protein